MGEWDATTYEAKDNLMRVLRGEAEALFAMASAADSWEFDPGSLVLTTFGRINAGAFCGDRVAAEAFLNVFFRI